MESRTAVLRTASAGARLWTAAGVFTATSLGFLATGATLPVVPLYVHGPLAAGDLAVGVVTGAFAVTAVVTRPVAGRLADARGPRAVLLAGTATMVAAGLLLFVHAGVPGVVLSRLVLGCGEGMLFTAASTWIVELAPPERRGQIVGLFGLSVWGGVALGTLAGALLRAALGYDAVWLFAAICPAAAMVIVLLLRDEHRPTTAHARREPILREIALPGTALALANFGYATFVAFIVLDLAGRGGGGALIFTLYAVTVVATRVLLGRLPDRIGPRRCTLIAGSLETLGLALIASARSWPLAAVGAVVMACGFSLFFPALTLVVLARVSEHRRGSALGLFTAFFDASMGIGAPLAGVLAGIGGYDAAFWGSAVVAGLATLLVWRRLRWNPSQARVTIRARA